MTHDQPPKADPRFGPLNCPACHGQMCHGGRNIHCAQRHLRKSHIAGILDSYGGVRVVVTQKNRFKYHVRCDEYLCLASETTYEPVEWNEIPYVVKLGETAVEAWVKRNAGSNDPAKRDAIRAYLSRKTWHPSRKGSLDLSAICFT